MICHGNPTGDWNGTSLTSGHHYQRLYGRRVTFRVYAPGWYGWWYGMAYVTDLLLLLGILMPQTLTLHRGASLTVLLNTSSRRTSIGRCCWTTIWERWFQNEWFPNVSWKCEPEWLNLLLHVWHRPWASALLQDPHMPGEVFSSVRVEIWIRGCNGDLERCQYIVQDGLGAVFLHTKCRTVQVKTQ